MSQLRNSLPVKKAPSGECIILCIDNSESQRNEDYSPSRWEAQSEAALLYLNGNEANSVGVVTMAGKRPRCLLPPTKEKHKSTGILKDISLEGECNNTLSIQLAQMILRNRPLKDQTQKIVWFVGSHVEETLSQLLTLANGLRKSNVSIEVIDFGEMSSLKSSKLHSFVSSVNKNGTGHYVSCKKGEQLAMMLLPLFTFNENPYNVWQRSFGFTAPETSDERKIRTEKEVKEATKKAEANGMGLLPLSTVPLCSKAVLDLTRYRVTMRQMSIPVTFTLKNNKLVAVISPPSHSRKLLAVFKAGRMLEGPDGTVIPLTEKGELSLWQIDHSSLEIQWKNRTSSAIELELPLPPGMVTYKAVAECTTGKVYLIELKKPNSILVTRFFFWSQESPSSIEDKEFWFVLNRHLDEGGESLEMLGESLSVAEKESFLESLDLEKLLEGSNLSALLKDSLSFEIHEEDEDDVVTALPTQTRPLKRQPVPPLIQPRILSKSSKSEEEDLPPLEDDDPEERFSPFYHLRSQTKSKPPVSSRTNRPFFPSLLGKVPTSANPKPSAPSIESKENGKVKGGTVVTPSNIQDLLTGRTTTPKEKPVPETKPSSVSPPSPPPSSSLEETREDSVLVTASNISDYLEQCKNDNK